MIEPIKTQNQAPIQNVWAGFDPTPAQHLSGHALEQNPAQGEVPRPFLSRQKDGASHGRGKVTLAMDINPSGEDRLLPALAASVRPVQSTRSASIFLTSAMARAGFRPLGQTWAQFMMVWQR